MSVEDTLKHKLNSEFQPSYLEVVNESHMHSVPPNSETHFKLVIVSESFLNKRAVARHQSVYQLLNHELQNGVHALALHTYTPEEWDARQNQAPDSPNCMGGSKHDHK